MWTKMIEVADMIAPRFGIPPEEVKAKLPINPRYGTITYEGKIRAYYQWEDEEPQIIKDKDIKYI